MKRIVEDMDENINKFKIKSYVKNRHKKDVEFNDLIMFCDLNMVDTISLYQKLNVIIENCTHPNVRFFENIFGSGYRFIITPNNEENAVEIIQNVKSKKNTC